MTNRENFFSIVHRTGYEHIPVQFNLCPGLQEICQKKLHITNYEDHFQMPWRFVDDLYLKNHDTKQYQTYYTPPLKANAEINLWGVGHEKSSNSMHMSYMRHPLENMNSLEEIMAYPFPDFSNADGSHQVAQVQQIKANDLIAAGLVESPTWENAWYLRGMEELFCDMMEDNPIAEYLLDKITEISIIRGLAFVRAGVDLIYTGDDIGMQHTTMMSESLYCKWLKPRLKKFIAALKAENPNVIILYHSCGFIEPLIPHLIDAGIDILNPIQSECMDFKKIHDTYGTRLSFHGTIGTQTLMPFGTPEQIKKEVWKNLDIAGEKGGLLVAPTHMLEPEVPFENILAYVDACHQYHR